MLRKKAPGLQPQEELGVIGRKWLLCPFIQQHQIEEIIRMCEWCGEYFSLCCIHPFSGNNNQRDGHVCHHRSLVFTDGACLNNGKQDARAGCGVVVGTAEDQSYSLPLHDEAHVTSQRAELIAAYEGIARGMKHFRERKTHPMPVAQEKRTELVIATDSEYVVAGMTQWLPKWKAKGFKNASGKTPGNLDLFLKIDEKIKELEEPEDIVIGFWHVPRKYNVMADRLAKSAAEVAVEKPVAQA
ncbi:ribonuclease H-like domain-containing protein [Phyllosticta citriasiana]|uniref:ribonuclease H-like domain-containing protein n=1 Tax=Phyllosticta citriasiana TaxID=595635 RepID=UPI0030FDC6BD